MYNYWNNRLSFDVSNENTEMLLKFINKRISNIENEQSLSASRKNFILRKENILESANPSRLQSLDTANIEFKDATIRIKDSTLEIMFRSFNYIPRFWFKDLLEQAKDESLNLKIESFYPENDSYMRSLLDTETSLEVDVTHDVWTNELKLETQDYLALTCYEDPEELEHRAYLEGSDEFDKEIEIYKKSLS